MLVAAALVAACVVAMPILAMHAEGRYKAAGRGLGQPYSPTMSVVTTVTESYSRKQTERLPDGTSMTTVLADPKGSTVFGKLGAGTRTTTTDDFSDRPYTEEQPF